MLREAEPGVNSFSQPLTAGELHAVLYLIVAPMQITYMIEEKHHVPILALIL